MKKSILGSASSLSLQILRYQRQRAKPSCVKPIRPHRISVFMEWKHKGKQRAYSLRSRPTKHKTARASSPPPHFDLPAFFTLPPSSQRQVVNGATTTVCKNMSTSHPLLSSPPQAQNTHLRIPTAPSSSLKSDAHNNAASPWPTARLKSPRSTNCGRTTDAAWWDTAAAAA